MKKVTKIYKENDNELLNRIRQHDDLAMEIMIEKYKPLIYTNIIRYHFPINEQEDYLQEGILVLVKAIEKYRDDLSDHKSPKTFTRYFELLLHNRFNSLYRKIRTQNQYVLLNDNQIQNIIDQNITPSESPEFNTGKLSKLEDKVFNLYFIQGLDIKDIGDLLKLSNKQVYNTIFRIKKKIN